MPLFKCPDCNKEVSDRAKSCPHCGRPVGMLDGLKSGIERAASRQVPPCPHCGEQLGFMVAVKGGSCNHCGGLINREEIQSAIQEKQYAGKSLHVSAKTTFIVGLLLIVGLLVVMVRAGMLGEDFRNGLKGWALEREQAKQRANTESDATEKEKTHKGYSFTTPTGTLERTVEEIAVEVMGARANWESKKPTIIKVENNLHGDGGRYIILKYRRKDNLSKGLIRQGILLEAMEFYEKVFSDSRCSTITAVSLDPQFMFSDAYGKSFEERIALLDLRRETARKIHWQNMTTEMFKRLLELSGGFWAHHDLK